MGKQVGLTDALDVPRQSVGKFPTFIGAPQAPATRGRRARGAWETTMHPSPDRLGLGLGRVARPPRPHHLSHLSRASRPWHTWAAALFASGLLAACGGGGGSSPEPSTPPAAAGSLALARSGEVVAQAQRVLRARTAGSGSAYLAVASARLIDGATATAGSAAAAMGAADASAVPTSAGGQLLLEAGIDEPDLLKADAAGTVLWSIDSVTGNGPQVQAHRRAADGTLTRAARMAMVNDQTAWFGAEGLALSPDAQAATAIGTGWTALPFDQICGAEVCIAAPSAGSGGAAATMIAPGWLAPRVLVQRFALAAGDGSAPVSRLSIEGSLVDQRQIGQQLVLVTRHRPVLALDLLPATATAAQREAAIAGLSAAQLLPRLRINGGAEQPLVQETDCWLQADNASPLVEFTTVTVIDLSRADMARTSRCFAGGAEALHLSGNALVLAQTNVAYVLTDQGTVYADKTTTQIHLFTLTGSTLAWQASGQVPGHLGWDRSRAPYRLSVHDGLVRVLSFTGTTGWLNAASAGSTAPSPATLSILRASSSQAGRLEVVGSLPNAQRPQPIGKAGEQLYGVRFVGNRAYAVTFRLTDPLYVLDLADPQDPRIAGELELPGFSDHLLPLPNGLLLGVGHDATPSGQRAGLQLALFDVADAARPRLLQRLSLGAAGSGSAMDHSRQGMSLVMRDQFARLALPVVLTSADWGPRTSSLQTAMVDTQARTLGLHTRLAPSTDDALADLWHQRSLQFGDQLYWLRAGSLLPLAW